MFQPGDLHAGSGGGVLESPVAAVAVQDVGPEVGHQHVLPAVTVVVRHGDAASPVPLAGHAGSVGDVLEGAVALVAIEAVAPLLNDARAVELPAVDDVDIQQPVAVEVDPAGSGSRRIEQVILAGASRVQHAREPRGLGDVGEVEPARPRGSGGAGGIRGARRDLVATSERQGHREADAEQPARQDRAPDQRPAAVSFAYSAATSFHAASRDAASGLGASLPMRPARSRNTFREALVTMTKPSSKIPCCSPAAL